MILEIAAERLLSGFNISATNNIHSSFVMEFDFCLFLHEKVLGEIIIARTYTVNC